MGDSKIQVDLPAARDPGYQDLTVQPVQNILNQTSRPGHEADLNKLANGFRKDRQDISQAAIQPSAIKGGNLTDDERTKALLSADAARSDYLGRLQLAEGKATHDTGIEGVAAALEERRKVKALETSETVIRQNKPKQAEALKVQPGTGEVAATPAPDPKSPPPRAQGAGAQQGLDPLPVVAAATPLELYPSAAESRIQASPSEIGSATTRSPARVSAATPVAAGASLRDFTQPVAASPIAVSSPTPVAAGASLGNFTQAVAASPIVISASESSLTRFAAPGATGMNLLDKGLERQPAYKAAEISDMPITNLGVKAAAPSAASAAPSVTTSLPTPATPLAEGSPAMRLAGVVKSSDLERGTARAQEMVPREIAMARRPSFKAGAGEPGQLLTGVDASFASARSRPAPQLAATAAVPLRLSDMRAVPFTMGSNPFMRQQPEARSVRTSGPSAASAKSSGPSLGAGMGGGR